MGIFKDLNKTSRGYSTNYLREGRYVVRIDECDMFTTDAEDTFWKTTLTILAVDEGGEDAHRVGEQVHIMVKRRPKYKEMFLQSVKGFIAGVLDVPDADVGEAEADAVLSDENPLAGLVAVVTARTQASKSAKDDDGNPIKYVVPAWQPSLDSEEIAAAIGEEAVERFFPSGL